MKYLCLLVLLSSCIIEDSRRPVPVRLDEGEECWYDSDCLYGTCLELQGEALCASECEIQSDCPYFPDQACFYTSGDWSEAHCLFLCYGDLDCPLGYSCQLASRVPSDYYICWPL
jgi:hypothetical protein